MKQLKIYSLSLALLSLAACGGNSAENTGTETKDSTLLSTELVNNPRSAGGIDSVDSASMPTIDFKDTVHEFGKIRDGEIVTHEFEFTNNGKKPLIISGATATCGCTVPAVPREAIAPGESGVIKVRFDSSHKSGHQEKRVDVKTNTARGTHYLVIKAEVEESKNKPLNNLKPNS